MKVIFSPKSERDIEDIGDFIQTESPRAAVRLMAKLRDRCGKIADMPRSGSPRPQLSPGLRSVAVAPYVIFYSIYNDSVRIERVLHGARDLSQIFGPDRMQ